MSATPLISVIIPVYNTAPFLSDALRSVLQQTYSNLEIIVVDDGSTDDSPAICRDFAACDSRIRLIAQTNNGQSAARNAGLNLATGEYITFMDSDDIIHPIMVEQLLTEARSSSADIIATGFKTFHSASPLSTNPTQASFHTITSDEALSRILYQRGINTGVCGKLFRRSTIAGLRFITGMLYEDLEFMPRAIHASSSFSFSDTPLYYYRQHAGSTIGHFHPRRLDALRATESVERFIAGSRPHLLPAAQDRKLSANFNMTVLLSRNRLADSPEARRCWTVIRQLRLQSLTNPHVRFKNKAGILASFLGRRIFSLICRITG